MNTPVLFLHVPKTAGSTVKSFLAGVVPDFCLQANSAEQLAQGDPRLVTVHDITDIRRVLTTRGGLALHVDSTFDRVRKTTDFRSLAHLVFDPAHAEVFSRCTILLMLRHPFRRFLSEFAFVRRMRAAHPGFLPDLDLRTVEGYFEQVHPNAQLHFLLEPDLARPRRITDDDLARVIARITEAPIAVGIHERFDDSIALFSRAVDIPFTAADLPRLNAGSAPPPVPAGLEEAFLARNTLDVALYTACSERLERQTAAGG